MPAQSTRRLALIAAIPAILALIWILATHTRCDGSPLFLPSGDRAGAASLSVPHPDLEPTPPPATERDAIAAEPAPTPPVIGWRGRLAWRDDDAPIAGVALRLRAGWRDVLLPLPAQHKASDAPEEDADAVLASVLTHTDRAGRFEIPAITLPLDLLLWIDPDGPLEHLHKLGFAVWPGSALELGTIWLDRRGGIEGRLVDAEGNGVAGARVRAFDLPLDPLVLDASRRKRLLTGDQEMDRDGMWSDQGGLGALPRWVVDRDQQLPFPETLSGADGAFALPSVRPGPVHLVAQARGKRDVSMEVNVRPGVVASVELAIPTGQHWEVIVTRGDRPVAGVEVSALVEPTGKAMFARERKPGRSSFTAMPPAVRTDPSGTADLGELDDGLVSVALRRAPGWPWEVYSWFGNKPNVATRRTAPDGSEIHTAHLSMRELAQGSWDIVDEDGHRLERAIVELYSMQMSFGTPPERLPDALQPKRGEDGIWSADLPPSTCRLAARAPGHLALTTPVGPSKQLLTLTLTPSFAMTIAVVDPSGTPVSGALVYARSEGIERHIFDPAWRRLIRDGFPIGTTDRDGLLRCDGLVPGRLCIAADHPDFARSPALPVLATPDSVVTVAMQRGGIVQGFVTERGEAPTERRLVVARPGPDLMKRWGDNDLLQPREVSGAPDGAFEIRRLCEGQWMLATMLPDDPDAIAKPPRARVIAPAPESADTVWIHEGGTVRHDLQIEVAEGDARVQGRVDIDGVAMAGTMLRLSIPADPDRGHDAPWQGTTTTDAAGQYVFRGAPRRAGSVEVLFNDRGIVQVLARCEVKGKTRELDIAVRTATLRARVLTAEGFPVSNREVTLAQAEGGASFKVATDAAGQVDVVGLPAGKYQLHCNDARGKERRSQPFDVAQGRAGAYDLTVE